MTSDRLGRQVLKTWQVHDQIHRRLIEAIPAAGFAAVPLKSRGRTVAEQLAHLRQVRLGWLHYHTTGRRPRRADLPPLGDPTRARLVKAFAESGAAIEEHLARALAGEARIRSFGGSPVRWMGYLISHESHHRGQIALALKQQGLRLPEEIAMQALWGSWMFGK